MVSEKLRPGDLLKHFNPCLQCDNGDADKCHTKCQQHPELLTTIEAIWKARIRRLKKELEESIKATLGEPPGYEEDLDEEEEEEDDDNHCFPTCFGDPMLDDEGKPQECCDECDNKADCDKERKERAKRKPKCFGDENCYEDPNDKYICEKCEFENGCVLEIDKKKGY